MATLVLTAVGTAVGGPIGGAIGAIVGQQIDGRLFAPKPRQGPRLGELAVQTSSYGSQIPKLFGTMRVAGTVIWATDLHEERSTGGGGKGRPRTVDYSYSANFAVALSGRAIRTVRRIWADGKLLRGAAGDFKTATGYRLHPGGEDQAVDPLIASVEGPGLAPAYRGIAYAVFEDFQLADYGNRIPSLTFEVEADAGAVGLIEVAAALGGLATAGGSVALTGYAAGGDSVRAAIAALSELEPLSLVDDGQGLAIAGAGAGAPAVLEESETGVSAPGAGGRGEWLRRSGDSVPAEASLAYYDPGRDFQTGLQRASRPGPALLSDRRAVAAALDSAHAKALAADRLDRLWAGRRSARLHLGWSRLGLPAGSPVRIAGRAGLWKVERWTLDRMVLTLELRGLPAGGLGTPGEANPGRPVEQPDLVHGPTTLLLLDLPLPSEELPARPRLLVAAAGAEPGWRRAELTASFDGGASWAAAGSTAPSSVLGTAVGAPAPAGSALADERGGFEVELLNETMWLESRSDSALADGANLALLGDELIQFGSAEPLGDRRVRLSRLLRGRRGTEWAAGAHVPGEPFLLVEAESLAGVDAPLGSLGGEARLLGQGLGDPDGVLAVRTVTGEAMRPPSPVHLRAQRLADGGLALAWVRRSRSGWVWLSGSDTPLGEESESYRLTLAGAGFERSLTVPQPAYLYSAVEQAADGLSGPLTVTVVQLGTSAPSRPASLIID
jgi:hypothetical protein